MDASAAGARRYPAIGISTITSGRQGNALNSLRQISSDGAAYPIQTLSSDQVKASPTSSDGYFITGEGGAVSSIYGYDGRWVEPLATGGVAGDVSYTVVVGGVDVDASETSDMAKRAADSYGGEVYGLNNQTVDPVSDFIEVADNRR